MMSLLLSKQKNKKLLKLSPGSYYKVDENKAILLKESKVGLVVSSYISKNSGNTAYDVVLVDGELLLVAGKDPCRKNLQ